MLEEVEKTGGRRFRLVAYSFPFFPSLLLIFLSDLLRLSLLLCIFLCLFLAFLHTLWLDWVHQYIFQLLHGYLVCLLRQTIPFDLIKAKLVNFLKSSGQFPGDFFELYQCVVTKRRCGGIAIMPLINIMGQICK